MDYWSNLKDIYGEPPEKDDSVLLSYATEQRISQQRGIPCAWDHIPTIPSSAWRDRLIELLGRAIWGFRKTIHVEGSTHFNVYYENANAAPYNTIIIMGVDRIEAMLDQDMTLAEICMTQVDIALTMMHELMHAILMVRYKDDDYEGNCLDHKRSGDTPTEPFLNGTGIAETGHYMDQLFFGGTKALLPVPRGNSLPPFASVMREFPWTGYPGHAAPGSAFLAPGHVGRVHHVPVTWASKFLTESFWNDPAYPRKSDNFFHRNPVVFSDVPNTTVRARPAQAHEVPYGPYSNPDDALLMENWKERERLWDGLRQGWYAEAKAEWEDSPWGDVYGRRSVERFALAFGRRDFIACAKIAHQLSDVNWWRQSEEIFNQNIPSPVEVRPKWAIHAIGLLMMASIPLVRSKIVRPEDTEFWFQQLRPSKEASPTGEDPPVYLPLNFETHEYWPESVEPSQLYSRPLEGMSQEDLNQSLFLRLIDILIISISKTRGLIHTNMLTAILTARRAIGDDRAAFGQNARGPEGSTLWSTRWFFEFPEYDQSLRQWDGERWMQVRRPN
ncbi:hypothetical protein ANO14919_060080 [Xylariales sp. No.14919]|nr:hypothetical protein ANO14919_060080 [Xylariales sp. No.14919]